MVDIRIYFKAEMKVKHVNVQFNPHNFSLLQFQWKKGNWKEMFLSLWILTSLLFTVTSIYTVLTLGEVIDFLQFMHVICEWRIMKLLIIFKGLLHKFIPRENKLKSIQFQFTGLSMHTTAISRIRYRRDQLFYICSRYRTADPFGTVYCGIFEEYAGLFREALYLYLKQKQ